MYSLSKSINQIQAQFCFPYLCRSVRACCVQVLQDWTHIWGHALLLHNILNTKLFLESIILNHQSSSMFCVPCFFSRWKFLGFLRIKQSRNDAFLNDVHFLNLFGCGCGRSTSKTCAQSFVQMKHAAPRTDSCVQQSGRRRHIISH